MVSSVRKNMDTLKTNKTSLILHGHFYQPPRENPRTDIIEIQGSAVPYDNWNERIWASCYRANAHSRYLLSNQIESISNNYEYISFNFGPTLLSWMVQEHPDTFEDIVTADKASIQRLGHGNAIAQGFNHTILPLDSKEDALVEIKWALDVFNRYFGRTSEGFWCPETAINPVVIDLLAQCGVKYVILSPWQCRLVEDENKKMVNLNGKPAPYHHPYILTGKTGGTLTAFFYHPSLASDISFGHLLRDADNFYKKLLYIKNQDKVDFIHTATDGEIYGHHEPYGDMALCALIRKVNQRDDFVMTNYGAYLENHPATLHAELSHGEDDKGTSWSCFHGVSRWYKDCGCRTGGEQNWNQKWRTPLRIALSNNHERIMNLFSMGVRNIFGDSLSAYQLLADFGPVAAKQIRMQAFLDELYQKHPYDKNKQGDLAKMLEGVMYSLYSFTSCGWFFSDLGGLEPKQNITYALEGLNFFQRLSNEEMLPQFLLDLQQAKCNRPTDGDGMTIAAAQWARLPGAIEASLFFYLSHCFNEKIQDNEYGFFHLENFNQGKLSFVDTFSLSSFIATIEDTSCKEPNGALTLFITVFDGNTEEKLFSRNLATADIPEKMFRQLNEIVRQKLCLFDNAQIVTLAKEISKYSSISQSCKYLSPGILDAEALGLSFTAIESIFLHNLLSQWKEMKESFFILASFVAKAKRDVDRERLSLLINQGLKQVAKGIKKAEKIEDSLAQVLYDFLRIIRKEDYILDLTEMQEAIYPFITTDCSSEVRTLGYELNFATIVEHAQDLPH